MCVVNNLKYFGDFFGQRLMDWVSRIRAIVVQIGLQGGVEGGTANKGALEVYNHTLPGGPLSSWCTPGTKRGQKYWFSLARKYKRWAIQKYSWVIQKHSLKIQKYSWEIHLVFTITHFQVVPSPLDARPGTRRDKSKRSLQTPNIHFTITTDKYIHLTEPQNRLKIEKVINI